MKILYFFKLETVTLIKDHSSSEKTEYKELDKKIEHVNQN